MIRLPGWASTTRYDLSAKILSDGVYSELAQDQKGKMMQEVLASRFEITAHFAMRDGPVYELVVDKKGNKMKKVSNKDIKSDAYVSNSGSIHGSALSMSGLAYELSNVLNRDVVDATELSGWYRVDLEWDPSDSPADHEDSADAGKPSIYVALPDQLGVRLVPAKTKTRFLVIDHINHLVPN